MAVHAAKPATHAGHLCQQWHGHHTWVTPLLGQHGYKAGQGPGQGFIVQKMASPTATQPMVFTLPSNGSQMLYLDNTATDYRVQLPSQIVLNSVGSFMFLPHHKHIDEEDIHQALQDAVPRQLQQHPKCLGWAEWWDGSHSLSGSMPHDRSLQASLEIVHGLGGHHTVPVPAARLARRGDGAHRAWQHVHWGPILTKARVNTQCVHSLLPGPWMPTWWAMSITAYCAPCLQRADLARSCTTNCTGWTGCQCAGPSSSMSTWLWWTATARGCHSRAGPAQLSCRWGWEVELFGSKTGRTTWCLTPAPSTSGATAWAASSRICFHCHPLAQGPRAVYWWHAQAEEHVAPCGPFMQAAGSDVAPTKRCMAPT